MTVRWLVAALHLLALGIGLGAVWSRGRQLRGALDPPGLRRVFSADAWWGVAALLWISTGLLRLLTGLEKGTNYYLHNHLFWTKMGLFGLILLLEIGPMLTFIRWRVALARGAAVDSSRAGPLAHICVVQAVLVVLMVVVATGMARGYGAASAR